MSGVGTSRWDAWRPRAWRVALAACSAGAFVLAVEVDALWWLLLLAWVPWLWMLEDLDPRAAVVYSTLTGVAATHFTHMWMFKPIFGYVFPPFWIDGSMAYGEAAWPWSNLALAGFSVWQGLMWGVAGGILVALRRMTGLGVIWMAPTCVALVEAAYPDLFPLELVTPLAAHPWWTQLAELGGVAAVTFAVLVINAAAYRVAAGLRAHRRVDRIALGVLALGLLGVPGYGAVRVAMLDATIAGSDTLSVGLVQGNFGIATARTHRMAVLRGHQKMTRKLERQGAQVVVWGETAYPFAGLYSDSERAPLRGNRRVVRRLDRPIVFGLRTHEFPGPARAPGFSSAWVLRSDGSLGDRYDKTHPMPVIEEREHGANGRETNPYRIAVGDTTHALEVAGHRVGALLGHEDLLASPSRDATHEGVSLLVSLANESWFGATRAQVEHLRIATFRAVENRRGLVRVANAGISAYVDPAGRVVESTSVTDPDRDGYDGATGFVASVAMVDPDSHTLYTRFAFAFPLALVLLTLTRCRRSLRSLVSRAFG